VDFSEEQEPKAIVNLVLTQLEQGDFEQRWEISKILPDLGTPALEPLLNILQDETADLEMRWFVARILGQFKSEVVIEPLINLLKTTEPEVTEDELSLQEMITATLASLGTSAIPPLTELLTQEESKRLATMALAQIRHFETITPLLTVVHDSNPEMRAIAIEALGSFPDHRVIPVLLDALNDPVANVRKQAIIGLGLRLDLLENINFKELKIAITGSIMTACAQYKHPLMKLFDNTKRYFDEYYYESDIDVMVMSENIYEFIDIAKQFHEKLMLNCCQYMNAEVQHVKYNLVRTSYLFVTSEFIKEHICPKHNIAYDVIIKNLELKTIINLFVPYAKKMHEMECKNKIEGLNDVETLKLMDKYAELFLFDETNLVIKIKDSKTNTTMINTNANNVIFESEYSQEEIEMMLHNTTDDDKFNITIKMVDGLGFSDNYKVKISAYQLSRDFELFPVFKDDFMSTVANFHMPCVRAYYNGENVFMTPSFISAHMTFMNIDYKYFAGIRDPIDILNKYRMRGFGILLNDDEKQHMAYYNGSLNNKWNNMFNVNLKNKDSISKFFGPQNINSNIFKPLVFLKSFPKDIYNNVPTTRTFGDNVDLADYLRTKKSYDSSSSLVNTLKLKTINEDGKVEPLKKWVIEGCY